MKLQRNWRVRKIGGRNRLPHLSETLRLKIGGAKGSFARTTEFLAVTRVFRANTVSF